MRNNIYHIFLLFTIAFTIFPSGYVFAKSTEVDLLPDTLYIFSDDYLKQCSKFLPYMKAHNINKAISVAKRKCNDEIVDFLHWYKYIEYIDGRDIIDIDRFLRQSIEMPKHDIIQKNLELAFTSDFSNGEIIDFFKDRKPVTDRGTIFLAQAMLEQNSKDNNALEMLKSIWITNKILRNDEHHIMEKYNIGSTQKEKDDRIETLIWNNNINDAKKILYEASDSKKPLFTTRIKLLQNAANINSSLDKLSKRYLNNEGLIHSRIIWQTKNSDDDEFITGLLRSIPKESDFANYWVDIRIRHTYFLIKHMKYIPAYKVISEHNIDPQNVSGSMRVKFAHAEWLAGWVALRFMEDPKRAYKHFYTLYKNVSYPISKARGAYWIARAFEDMDNEKEALNWYKEAASYPTTFYGQMALFKYATQHEVNLISYKKATSDYIKQIIKNDKLVNIAYFLYLSKQNHLILDFLLQAIENNKNINSIAAIVNIAGNILDPDDYKILLKAASYKNVILIEESYPLLKNIKENDKNRALINAIIKQESGFKQSAVSSAGAIGFMQLMPATAKETARKLGVTYSSYRLRTDMEYNIQLGSAYLQYLLNRFDNSYILAIAAYNAGPGSVNRWIEDFGDPRNMKNIYDVIDWIELITFSETRNYVQRILAATVVYNHLISKEQKAGGK